MPRKKLVLKDPWNDEEIAAYIENHAQRSTSTIIQQSLHQMPKPVRTLVFRDEHSRNNFELVTYAQRLAVMTYVRGVVLLVPCNHCQDGKGPFKECIALYGFDDLKKMSCANCQWDQLITLRGHICSLVEEELSRLQDFSNHQPTLERTSNQNSLFAREVEPKFGLLDQQINPKPQNLTLQEAEHIHILGNLFLPPLREQPKPLRDVVEPLLHDLKVLHTRDMTTLIKPIADLDQAFNDFKEEELQSWRLSNSETFATAPEFLVKPEAFAPAPAPAPEFLVKPSGSFSSIISHRLNQPSFTTDFPENGETADRTNGCISMVMDSIPGRETFFYDQIHRRDETSHGCTRYPPLVRAAHQKWTEQLSACLEAKVEIVYGNKAMQPLITNPNVKSTPFPLWGHLTGVMLYLLHEENFGNAQKTHKFRRILLSGCHPQRLFYDPPDGAFNKRQEKIVAAAAALAGVHYNLGYYTQKLWTKIMPSLKWRRAETIVSRQQGQNGIINHLLDSGMNSPENLHATLSETLDEESEKDSGWESLFNPLPHSNQKLIELLPKAIKEAENQTSEWTDPDSLPEWTMQWLRGQKQILFYDCPLSDKKDLVKILDRCLQAASIEAVSKTIDRSSLRQVLLWLMKLQEQDLESRKASKSPKADLTHFRFDGIPIPVACVRCNRRADNGSRQPIFSVNHPNHYVIIGTRWCPKCKSRRELQPIYMPKVRPPALKKQGPLKVLGAKYSFLVRDSETLKAEQKVVECFCILCKERTKVSGDKSTFVDNKGQWTLGNFRPLYVERRAKCLTCGGSKVNFGRFIPVDSTIPSISKETLGNFIDAFGSFDTSTIAILLDHWPPSSRTFLGNTLRYQ